MATILKFPFESRSDPAAQCSQAAAGVFVLAHDLLSNVRHDLQRSLFMLDLAIVQLRRDMPEHMHSQFDETIVSIETLLAAARREAEKI